MRKPRNVGPSSLFFAKPAFDGYPDKRLSPSILLMNSKRRRLVEDTTRKESPLLPPERVDTERNPGRGASAASEPALTEVEQQLHAVTEWSAEACKALKRLHTEARAEVLRGMREAKDSRWQQLEHRLFGDPERLVSNDEEHGQGFAASLIDGMAVDVFKFAGVEWTEELHERLWSNHNWQSLLDSCPAAEYLEVDEQDDVPDMSDGYFWVRINDPSEFARQLRELILGVA